MKNAEVETKLTKDMNRVNSGVEMMKMLEKNLAGNTGCILKYFFEKRDGNFCFDICCDLGCNA